MAANEVGAVAAHDRLLAAHQALLADRSIQFDLRLAAKPPEVPAWAKALGRVLHAIFAPIGSFLGWLGHFVPDVPFARVVFWTVIAFAVAAILWIVIERVRNGEWRLPRRRRLADGTVAPEEEEGWRPEAAPARALLAEADKLAASGCFAEAAHLLLHRSIEDIARRRPRFLKPALTSRDIAVAPALPAAARGTFAAIAGVVERSLFGGRAVDATDWGACREAYKDFALLSAWT